MKVCTLVLLLVLMISTMAMSMAVLFEGAIIRTSTIFDNSIDAQTIAPQGMHYWIVDLNIKNRGSQSLIVGPRNFTATLNNISHEYDQSATTNLASLNKVPLLSNVSLNASEEYNCSLAFMLPIVDKILPYCPGGSNPEDGSLCKVANDPPKLSYNPRDKAIVKVSGTIENLGYR